MSGINLVDLPEELLIKILKYVPRKRACLQTCSRLKEICEMFKEYTLYVNADKVRQFSE
jgi:hypothetical protein